MSIIHAPEPRRLGYRFWFFPVLWTASFFVVLLRLWYIQVVDPEALASKAIVIQKTSVAKLAPRGVIVDRKGYLLAGVRSEIIVTARPAEIKKHPWVLVKLASMLDVPKAKLEKKVKNASWRPYVPAPIYVGIPIEVATRIAEAGDDLPGLAVDTQPMRYYSNTVDLAHILGYVWTADERDQKRFKEKEQKTPEFVGKLGLEYVYEFDLMGKNGSETLAIDSRRRPIRTLQTDRPLPGNKLVLTLDLNLQKYAIAQLQGRPGAIVMLDPRNGEVLCMASSPTYDSALFQGGISQDDFLALMEDPNKPQLNRAIAAAYAPGSTFKILTSLAAAKKGQLSPVTTISCDGFLKVGNRKVRCLGRHGPMSFEQAFEKSCNTYFGELSLRAGAEAMREVCDLVGLGKRTGVDLRGESRGLVPTPEMRNPPSWYPGDTVNFGIGQGELLTTPLQMASLAALVANEGVCYRPHFVRQIIPPGEGSKTSPITPEVRGQIEISPPFWRSIKRAMGSVIETGTAKGARISGLIWCGKTGSAENKKNKKTHSWFVGFAPKDDPKVAICVLIEQAGHGGDVAAPLAARIIQRYLFEEKLLGGFTSSTTNSRESSSAANALDSKPSAR